MKLAKQKKSKLELEKERLLEKFKPLAGISRGSMEEESLPRTKNLPLDAESSGNRLIEQSHAFTDTRNGEDYRSEQRESFSVKKTMSMQELLQSKSRLSSPRGGNIYLSSTIVDELETHQKSRKPSLKEQSDPS